MRVDVRSWWNSRCRYFQQCGVFYLIQMSHTDGGGGGGVIALAENSPEFYLQTNLLICLLSAHLHVYHVYH